MLIQRSNKESHFRSVLKTLSWRIVATTTTFLLVYMFTGKAVLSASIGGNRGDIKFDTLLRT